MDLRTRRYREGPSTSSDNNALRHRPLQKATSKLFRCEKCDKHFKLIYNFRSHMRFVHSQEVPAQEEVVIKREREFDSSGMFDVSVKRSSGGEDPDSSSLRYQPSKASNLQSTISNTSTNPAVDASFKTGSYSCHDCRKTYKKKQSFSFHIAVVHQGKKINPCPICGRCWMYRDGLRSHLRTHTGERPFSCTLCARSFILKQHYTVHVKRIHKVEQVPLPLKATPKQRSGFEEGFYCEFCGKEFSSKEALDGHAAAQHPEEKPFKCIVCKRRFARKDHLARHTKLVHERTTVAKCP